MVLFLSEEAKAAKKDKQAKYKLINLKDVAVVQEASVEEPPEEEEINAALTSLEVKNSAPFIIRCDGIIDNTAPPQVEEDDGLMHMDKEPTLMEILMDDVETNVSKRENITIINRGYKGSEYLEPMVLQLFKAIKTSAEHGMQVVADEIAKERQMQRLLQLEADEEQGATDTNALKPEANRELQKNKGLPLSSKLAMKLRELRKEFPYESAKMSQHGERYTLLSAAHGDELLPPCKSGSCLVPSSFITNPPVYRSGANNAAGHEATLRSTAHVYQKMRRATTTVMNELELSAEEREDVEPLPGNGWGEDITFYKFNGDTSIMALPGVPKFEEMIKHFAVDFWMRSDCKVVDGHKVLIQIMESREDVGQMFSLVLNFYPEMKETLRLFIRDSQNRVLEGYIPLHDTDLLSGEHFHHVMIKIYNLDECLLECTIDGVDHQFSFLQQEHPIGFNSWPHRLFIGGYLDENHAPQAVFRGSMMELRFWTGKEDFQPIIRWPLMVRDGPLIEVTKTIPEDHHETLQNLTVAEEPAPRCAPVFDGRLVVNMGTLPLWGQLMHNWRIEIRFRTTATTRLMTLVGATDRKFKMQQIGIALNAEPVSSKDRFRFHELNVTFYIVDCFGACCSALLRGTERENVMDGEWHTIVWRCVDAEQNNFMVSVDGVQQNLLFVSREGPNRFAQYDDWVCLGGHNVRSWKVQKTFEGEISRFYLSLRGHHYVSLEMNEGPGAYVLQDFSGHRNHGLILDSENNAIRKNDVSWVPVPPERLEDEDNKRMEIVTYRNNAVSIAAVLFTGEFDENMIPHEVLYDLFRKEECSLEVLEHHISDPRPQWGHWSAIPNSCFRPLQNVTQLEEALNEVLAAKLPCGHLMVVVRIGDCHVTLLQLFDMELPPEAIYNTNMLRWHYPFGFEGYHGRRELMLHRMIESVEQVLVADSLTPFTTAKLGPLNSGATTVVSENIAQALRNNGKPWYLSAVLHNHLLNTEYGSHIHIIHRFGSVMSFDEAAALCMFNKKLYDRSKEMAAMVIQRNWRACMGKSEWARRDEIRKIKNLKVEDVRTVRMDNIVRPKKLLHALFITLHNTQCEGVPKIKATTSELEETLQKQGYQVDYLMEPDPAKMLSVLADLDLEALSFIYISGYGGQLNVRQTPIFSLQSLHISLEEGAARARIWAEEGPTFRALMAQFLEDKKNVTSKKKKKKGDKSAPPPRGKKAQSELDAMMKQMETLFQEALMEVERDEAFLRENAMKEYEGEVAAITNEMRLTIYATNKFLKKYRSDKDDQPMNFIYPSMCTTIEPYASLVMNVEDVINIALSKGSTIMGFQRILAIDLQPITPYSQGFACIASSTGNTLRFCYKPQQRRFLSWNLKKAFDGHAPIVAATNKYAVLSGGIETLENQRDWKSFATYITRKMKPACSSVAQYRAQNEELDRELLPFTAELIPIRDIVVPSDTRDRRRRDRDGGKVLAAMTFGVGSTKVQSDMFSFFKNIIEGLPLTEIVFTNTINILFDNKNKNIDAVLQSDLVRELEKCRPNNCTLTYSTALTSDGARVTFDATESADKMSIGQWIGSIVVRSLSWKIGTDPAVSYATLDVNYIEYVYHIKTNCKLRQFRHLKKQFYLHPVPESYVRFLELEEVIAGPPPK